MVKRDGHEGVTQDADYNRVSVLVKLFFSYLITEGWIANGCDFY
jgi:hypothetical protein